MSDLSTDPGSPPDGLPQSDLSEAEIDDLAALDALFHRSARYRSTREYKKFLDFVGRISDYSPYNAALLHVQNPGVTYTATPRQWRNRFDRDVERDARPYVILQPGGPVMMVYDVSQTIPRSADSPELPNKVTDPFEVKGDLSERTWKTTQKNCRQERIAVREDSKLHDQYGGRVEPNKRPADDDNAIYLVTLNADLDLEVRYVALAHELAHVFLGHLGADEDAWWDGRPDTSDSQKELEAQSVAYLVARRANLHSVSERYLHWYVQAEGPNAPIPGVRMRQVLGVVRYIEKMGEARFDTDREESKNEHEA